MSGLALHVGMNPLYIRQFILNYKDTQISTKKDVIITDIKDASLSLYTFLKFTLEPAYFFGEGKIDLDTTHINILSEFKLINNNGSLNFELTKLKPKIDTEHFKYNIYDETNDIFKILNMTGNFTINYLKNLFTKELKPEDYKNISKAINSVLEFIPQNVVLPGTAFNLFLDLMGKIETEEDHFFVGNNFSAICQGKCRTINNYKPKRPTSIDKHEDFPGVQFFLSDYTINTITLVAYQSLLLDNITLDAQTIESLLKIPFDTKLIGIIFPEIMKEGIHKVDLNFNVTKPPVLDYNKNDTTFNSQLLTAFSTVTVGSKNITKKLQFYVETKVSYKGYINLEKNKITGEIKEFQITTEVKKGAIMPDDTLLKALINTFTKLVVPQINEMLRMGITLPPTPVFNLSSSVISFEKDYLRIGFNTIKSNQGILEAILKWVINKLVVLYRRQKVIKEIKEKMPVNLPKWIKVNA